ncbi:hypothetical protein CEW81_09435 [Kluyvera genomosp. 3]|uniref:Lipoprotein n=1 Tax=Kluyvera genomosp. 3 TaxID=2774055 RepID=A0A248KHY0_9ENTR|nr:hypothetical protein CEW81_09435 [Kluyvera genomosp. 3]
MKTLLLLLPVFLVGCTTVSKTYGPDGKEAYELACSGTVQDWGDCQKKAGELCGTRGIIFSVSMGAGAVFTANPQSAFGSTTIYRNMMIACK